MDVIDVIISKFRCNASNYRICITVIYLISQNYGVVFLLKKLLEEYGYGNDVYGYNFPNIFDPSDSDDEYYFESGIQFYFHNDMQVVSNSEVVKLLKEFCGLYIESEYENVEEVSALLKEITTRFCNAPE